MRKRICLFLLMFCLLLSACGPAAPEAGTSAPEEPAETEMPERERNWVEDIEFLRKEYKEQHADPFYFCSEEEFNWKLDQLIAKVGELSDSDIFYEMDAILHGMGDTHTKLLRDSYPPVYNQRLVANILMLNGRLYVSAYLKGYEQFEPYLLHEVVGVNGVDSLYLTSRSAELYEPYNWHAQTSIPSYPTFFDWVGCDYKEGYTFQILNDNREVESVEVPVVPSAKTAGQWVTPENWDSIVFAKGGDRTAYYEGEDGGCIQWCIGEISSPSSISLYLNEVGKLMEEHPDCNKLAVDLRQCSGGSLDMSPFFESIRERSELLEGKEIYVLTWGNTASAATRMIAFLKDEFGAVTVGEPTGDFSSFFTRSEERYKHPTVLPHSQIKIQISDMWRDSAKLLEELDVSMIYDEYYGEDGRLYQWETCIQPDVFVHLDVEDLKQGKDTVMEWVLAQ